MSWKPEVQVLGEVGNWHSNALRFATEAEAFDSAYRLSMRWMAVVDYRAAPSDDPVNSVIKLEEVTNANP
jgi:hypothetical protein